MKFYRDKDNYPLLNGGWLKSFADNKIEAQSSGNLTNQEKSDVVMLKNYLIKAQENFSSGNYEEALRIIKMGINSFKEIIVKLSYSSDPLIEKIENFVTNTESKLKEEKTQETPIPAEIPSTGNAKQEMNKILQFVKAKNFKGAKDKIDALEKKEWFKDFMSKANTAMKNFYNDILKEVDAGLSSTTPEAAPTATDTPAPEADHPNNLYSSVSEIEAIDIAALKQNLENFKKETGSYGNNYYIKFNKVLKEIEKYLGFLTRTTASSSDMIVTSAPNLFSNMWNKYINDPSMSKKMDKMNQAEILPQKINEMYIEFGNLYNKINNLSTSRGLNNHQSQAIKYMSKVLYPFSAYQETQPTDSVKGGDTSVSPTSSEKNTPSMGANIKPPVETKNPEISENLSVNIKKFKSYLKNIDKNVKFYIKAIEEQTYDQHIDKSFKTNYDYFLKSVQSFNVTLGDIEFNMNSTEEIGETDSIKETKSTDDAETMMASNNKNIKKNSSINGKWNIIKK